MTQVTSIWKRLAPASAFEAAMAPQMDRLWRLAVRFQGNAADAEDLLQELMARAWEHRRTVIELDAPGPWLARVLYRLHVDRWRRRGDADRISPLDDHPEPEAASDDGRTALDQVAADEILREIATLPEHQRLVLLLHDGEGYRLDEIAEYLEVPVGTLKSRLHRARAAVRRQLADGTGNAGGAC